MKRLLFLFLLAVVSCFCNAQSVGIGTLTPNATTVLHIDAGLSTSRGILVSGTYNMASTVPDLGAGSRLMFYPGKAAFRAGYASATSWNNANVGLYSVALGHGTIASGYYSYAMGLNTISSGHFSSSFGGVTQALGNSSTAMGLYTISKGCASLVIGLYNDSILTTNLDDCVSTTSPLFIVGNGTADNARSNALVVLKNGNVGIGSNGESLSALLHVNSGVNYSKGFLVSGASNLSATVPDLNGGNRMMFYPGKAAFRAGKVFSDEWNNSNVGAVSVAMGYGTIASGTYSIALGDRSEATYEASTAFGFQTQATEYATTAIGSNTVASGRISTAIGYVTTARGYASTVVGLFNDPILAEPQTNVTSATPLFIVGNGASGALSNAMVVLKNGNVGIGTNAPEGNLVLNDADPIFQLQNNGVDKGFVQLSGDNLRMGVNATNPTGNVVFRLNGADRFTVFPTGNATLTGTLTQNSDERFKQDITPINDALDKVMQLNGYEYYWKPELQRDNALQIGLIAQNVEKVLPQLVATDKEGVKSVAYQNMVPVLIEAIKELQQQVKDQQLQIKELKIKVSN